MPGVPGDRSVTQKYTTTPKDPRIKNPGVFCFTQGNMVEIDSKKQIKQIEFTQQYTLSPEQFKKLIEEKMARAQIYSQSVRKRETVR